MRTILQKTVYATSRYVRTRSEAAVRTFRLQLTTNHIRFPAHTNSCSEGTCLMFHYSAS